ncbi:hypothetical protein FOZ62_024088, partial [Perkinsus olseni]
MKPGKAIGRQSVPRRNVAKLPASVRIRKPTVSEASESLGRAFWDGWNASVRLQLDEVTVQSEQTALRARYVSIGVEATFKIVQSGQCLAVLMPASTGSYRLNRHLCVGCQAQGIPFVTLSLDGWKFVCRALGVNRQAAVGFKPFAGTLPSLSSVIAAIKEASSLAGPHGGFPRPMPWDTQTLNISDFMRSSPQGRLEDSGGSSSSPEPTECDVEMPPTSEVEEAAAALPTPQDDDTLYDILGRQESKQHLWLLGWAAAVLPYPDCAGVNKARLSTEVIAAASRARACSTDDWGDLNGAYVVKGVSECAQNCTRLTTCSFWTVDGEFACWTIPHGGTGARDAKGFTSGTKDCYPLAFPECAVSDAVYDGDGTNIWFDAMAFGSDEKLGCYKEDCSWTDTFMARGTEECAAVCAGVPDCAYWSYSQSDESDGRGGCCLRSAAARAGVGVGVVSGTQACGDAALALRKRRPEQEDNGCWDAGFTA